MAGSSDRATAPGEAPDIAGPRPATARPARPDRGADRPPAILVEDVVKRYRRFAHSHRFQTLKSAMLGGDLFAALSPDQVFTALDGVDMRVGRGETFGIIGSNGAGKSTLLKLVAGTTKPTSGTVSVDGKISALIELGAGFHPEISGRENVFINGIMLGLSREQIRDRFDEIVAFAELEDFIDAPVKTYSSGMYMRLGFSVAIHVDPEVLLIDEVLAVGDEAFVHKCLDKIGEFKRRGKTILLVTHGLEQVRRLCDRAMWLADGRVRMTGDPMRVVDAYLQWVGRKEEDQLAAAHESRVRALREEGSAEEGATEDGGAPRRGSPGAAAAAGTGEGEADAEVGAEPGAEAAASSDAPYESGRWGNRSVVIEEVRLLDAERRRRHVFDCGETAIIEMRFRADETVEDFVFGIGIFDSNGVSCYGTNTDIERFAAGSLSGEGAARIVIPSLQLVQGQYYLDVAVHSRDGLPYDYHRGLWTFRTTSRIGEVGIARLPHTWEFEGDIRWQRTGGLDADAQDPRASS